MTSVSLKYSDLTEVLLTYKNINLRFLNIYEFSKGSLVENLIKSNKVLNSKYSLEHMSDVMRMLIISKYPGLYLDLDVISMAPLSLINASNFACAQSDNIIAGGIISINNKGLKVIELQLRLDLIFFRV